jgi:predicted DNA-binding transcriptional regulator AlpA
MMAGHFPRFRKIGMGVNGRVRWSETEVAEWAAAKIVSDATA